MPDYEINENKVRFWGYRFSRRLRKGKNKVKKNCYTLWGLIGSIELNFVIRD